jgi:hypothetical protein
MMDANEHVTRGWLSKVFKDLGLHESIISKHSNLHPPVATWQEGVKPIDSIFTTLDLSNAHSGYLAFGEGFHSDHRLAWLDIPYQATFGHTHPPLKTQQPSRLSLQDPRIVAKYHTHVLEEYEAHLAYDRVDDLCKAVEQGADLNTIILLYNGLNMLSRRLRKKVEKLLQKLKLGKVPWLPEIQRLMDERKLWSNVVKWKKRIKISKKKIY